MMMKRTLVALCAGFALAAQAQVTVKDPWVRSTVAGQQTSGLFAQIVSANGGRLVAVSSPVAGVAEIHEMTMDGSTMRMRAVPFIDLPAGKTVGLESGGYHVMLMELKQPLKAGETVPVTLVVEGAGGKRETVEVNAVVKSAAGAGHGMKH